MEKEPSASAKASARREASAEKKEPKKRALEQQGWTAEKLKEAQEALGNLIEAGRAFFDVPAIESFTPEGLALARAEAKKRIELIFSKDTLDVLRGATPAIATAAGILIAAPAFAGVQKEVLTESGKVTKTFTLTPDTTEFEVSAGADNLDIGEVKGFKKFVVGGRTLYRPEERLAAPYPLTIALNIPQSKRGTGLTLRTNTAHEHDLQLFEGGGGNVRWVLGEDATQRTNLSALARIEGSLISHKETKGSTESGWKVPVGLRIMQGTPDKDTPVALGLSAGYAYWNSDIGEIKGEVGTTFDPKTLRGALGRETLIALSYTRKAGKLEVHADVLSALGAQGKTAADIGVDLETKRFPTPAGDVVLSSGLGFGMEGWQPTKGVADKSSVMITPAAISFPFLGKEVKLSPGITRDLTKGDTGGTVDVRVR